MSFNYFIQQFDALGPLSTRASITIDLAFSGSADLILMLRAILDVDALTIDIVTDMTRRTPDQIEFFGTVSVLGFVDAQATLLAKDLNGELFVKLAIDVPPGWSFKTLYPELPGRGTGEVDEYGEKVLDPHFLTRLSLGQCRLIFTTAKVFDEQVGQTLLPGLNFAGELYLLGVLYTLGFLLDQKSATMLAGPVDEFRMTYDPLAFIGIRLRAPVLLDFQKVGPLSIDKAQIYIKAGINEYQRDKVVSATQHPGIYLLADGTFGGRPAEMIAKWDLGNAEDISIRGTFSDFALSGFANLSQNVGVDGIGDDMPEGLETPEGLALTEFGVTLGCIRPTISALYLGVGMKTNLDILPNMMTLREIGAVFYVADPFGTSRRIRTTLSGLLAFKKFNLAAYAELPTFRLGAGLPSGQTLSFGDVIESFIPGEADLPALTITQLRIDASPKEKTFVLSATVKDLLSIPVGATVFEVKGLAILVDYNQARGKARGIVTAQMSMAEAGLLLSGEVNNGLTLSGSVTNFELKKFWSLVTNGETLPEQVPDIIFETLSATYNTKTGAFSVLGNATIVWDYLKDEGISTRVEFSLSRSTSGAAGSQGSAFNARLSLQGTGPLEIAPDFTLETFQLLFDYQTNVGWKLSGGVGVDIFDTRLDLLAGYESAQGIQKIMLRAMATPAKTLIGMAGIGSYTFQQLDLTLDRRTNAGGKKQTYFDLRLASTLKIDSVFTIGGYLSISNTAEGKKALLFKPNPGSAAFHVAFPTGEGMKIEAELFEMGFVKESANAGWTFTGTTIIGFAGFPGFLGDALPSKVTGKLVAGSSNVSISALNVTDPVSIVFPKAHGKSLGKAVVQLTELGIAFRPALGLVIEAGLGLPEELNTYLGAQIFRVYQAGNPISMSRTRFTISGTGVAVQFVTSPFAAANTIVIEGETWFDINFGQYGAIGIKMPTFVYDGVSQYFEAGSGFKITRTLALPLAPLKMFLEACGGKDMADVFPAKIPINGLVLVDHNGDLKIDEFVAFVEKAGDVPSEVVTTLKQTGKVLNRFPDGFKQYFNLEIPTRLDFKFGFSPTGRISLGLLAPEKPIRVLFPAVVQGFVPMPGLWGIEVRKFSVGTIMAGSLLYGEVDAIIDQFDLPSLIVSLTLPNDPGFPLPTSDQLHRRITLANVFCVIPVSAGSPVPIPLFYDEIGFDYLGVEGMGLGVHLGFPKPGLDGAVVTAVFQAFDNFTSNPKALLDPKTPPGGADLKFVFHDEFLQAPEYLGGKVLGTQGKTIQVGLWQYIASLMNFGKTFSINDCIGAIPIQNRVGSANYRLAFMAFDADWLLTTPREFKNGAFEKLKLTASDCDDFMTVLPSVASTQGQTVSGNEEGLVAFVRGNVNLGFLRLDAALGLAASGSMGFNTGFKFEGKIGKVELAMQGAIMVNAPLASATPAAPAQQVPKAAPVAKAAPGSRALVLNGAGSWVEIPAADSLVLPEYTIELWIRSTQGQSEEWVEVFGVDTLEGGYKRNYYLEVNTKNAYYHHRFMDAGGGNSGAPNTPNGSVKWGQWQHVALTNDGVTVKTYIDGKEAASGSVNGALVMCKAPIFMGKQPGTGTNKRWNGDIAEVRIWKCARSADQIAEFMREVLTGDEQDLVSLYRFDGDAGARALDVCGRNHGTIKNGSFIDSGLLMLVGREFDGKTDYITIKDASSLRIGAYTVEAWIKPFEPVDMTGPQWAAIFVKKGRNYALFINKNGFVHHRFHTSQSWNEGAPNTASGVLAWNNWNHIAITNDGTTAKTYVNGVKMAEGPVGGNGLIIDKQAISMGRSESADAYFSGKIGEIRLWSGARSEQDVIANMGRRIGATSSGLVCLWRMSDIDRDTLADTCRKNPGLVANVTVEAQPVPLRHDGLVFDGTADYARIEESEKFATTQYTIETWVRPDKDPSTSWQCIWGSEGKAPKTYINVNGLVSHRYFATVKHTSIVMKNGVPTVKTTTSVDQQVVNTAVGVIAFGQWNHIAVTNDGQNFTIVVNGSQKARVKVPGVFFVDAAAINIGYSGASGTFFQGSIDDIRYWNVARSVTEIGASMRLPLTGAEIGLVAYYDMDHTAGIVLTDRGVNKLDGKVFGARWALAAAPTSLDRAAIQLQGYTHLRVVGHEAMSGDLQLADSTFWFRGKLDLFPTDWPVRVHGYVEGMVSKQRFYLTGDTENSLFGLVLLQSRLFLSNEQIRLEGQWLGGFLMLDISWDNDNPIFAGAAGRYFAADLEFGAIRIGGVKVADNVHLSLEIGADVSIVVSKNGFSADVHATFQINGQGFDVSFSMDIAPAELGDLVNWIKQKIIDAPAKYLAHLFSDPTTWLKNIGDDTIEFAKDVGEAVGAALKSAFSATKEQASSMMKSAGYGADQVGAALGKAYHLSATDAAKLLKSTGYSVEDVGNALKVAFQLSPQSAASILKSAGYSASDVNKALTSAYNQTSSQCESILKVVGYSSSDVNAALNKVGTTVTSGVKKAYKKAKFW